MRALKNILPATLLLATAVLAFSATPASADDWHHHGGPGSYYGPGWHGDIHHFGEYDYGHWRDGRWWQGFHGGRHGWWWIVDDGWYFYPQPIYPYPDPYTPPAVIVQTAPTAIEVAPSYLYYCANPSGYYPYVSSCYSPWQRVASQAVPVEPTPPPVVVEQPMMAAPPPVMARAPVMAPPPMGEPMDQRNMDDRELNNLGVEFQQVNLGGPHAASTLRNLERKIEAFRQTLYSRGYNATDIIRDADRLEHTVEAQREGLPRHK